MPSRDDALAVVRNHGLLAFTAPREPAPREQPKSVSLTLLARATNGDTDASDQRLAQYLDQVDIEGPWWLWSNGYAPPNRFQERLLRNDIASEEPYAHPGTTYDVDGRISWVRQLKPVLWRHLFVTFDAPWPDWTIVRATGSVADGIAEVLASAGRSGRARAAVERGWWLAATETDICTWSAMTFLAPERDGEVLERQLLSCGATALKDDDVATFLT